nr:PqqD family peptide modification chaperone [uncultured Methanospirillum sp.]
MSSNDSLPEILPQISLREEYDDWAFLYNPDTRATVGLTPSGVTVWKCLIEKKDLAGIKKALSEEFGDLPDDLETDIRAFLDQVVDLGFAKR